MKLTTQQWNTAATYIKTHARPIDQKIFSYFFEEGSKEEAIIELSRFQNADGGFGRSLEPDFRLDSSSPMATTVGLQFAKDLKLSASHPIVQKAMSYLHDTYDEQINGWHAVPEEVNSIPHAPWWHFDSDKGYCRVQTTWANPNAEIVGYFHLFHPEHPRLQEWTERAVTELKNLPHPIEMHDFLCYQRLLFEVKEETESNLYRILSSSVRKTVCTDPSRWNEYVAKPLQIASHPASPFYEALKAEVHMQLNVEIEAQHQKGYWHPSWSWFGQFDETWPVAEKEWRGILTLGMLRILKTYGRVEC
ncbi:hypothetical protein [Rossellomorea sp. y25]|uniref:hypothetical protein n=1 Tax=Rossellomorea sp. y25 TaxID=3118174 RepID=UPI0030E179C5